MCWSIFVILLKSWDSTVLLPVDKVQNLICISKNPFYCTQIISVGLSDLVLEDWLFWSLRKKEKLPLRDLRKLNI